MIRTLWNWAPSGKASRVPSRVIRPELLEPRLLLSNTPVADHGLGPGAADQDSAIYSTPQAGDGFAPASFGDDAGSPSGQWQSSSVPPSPNGGSSPAGAPFYGNGPASGDRGLGTSDPGGQPAFGGPPTEGDAPAFDMTPPASSSLSAGPAGQNGFASTGELSGNSQIPPPCGDAPPIADSPVFGNMLAPNGYLQSQAGPLANGTPNLGANTNNWPLLDHTGSEQAGLAINGFSTLTVSFPTSTVITFVSPYLALSSLDNLQPSAANGGNRGPGINATIPLSGSVPGAGTASAALTFGLPMGGSFGGTQAAQSITTPQSPTMESARAIVASQITLGALQGDLVYRGLSAEPLNVVSNAPLQEGQSWARSDGALSRVHYALATPQSAGEATFSIAQAVDTSAAAAEPELLVAGLAPNFAVLDRALEVALTEIEEMKDNFAAWLDEPDSLAWAAGGAAVMLAGSAYCWQRRRAGRNGSVAESEEQLGWLFLHLYDPSGGP